MWGLWLSVGRELFCQGLAFLETCFILELKACFLIGSSFWWSCYVGDVRPFVLPPLDDISSRTGFLCTCHLGCLHIGGQVARTYSGTCSRVVFLVLAFSQGMTFLGTCYILLFMSGHIIYMLFLER